MVKKWSYHVIFSTKPYTVTILVPLEGKDKTTSLSYYSEGVGIQEEGEKTFGIFSVFQDIKITFVGLVHNHIS